MWTWVGAGDQIISIDVINILQCHHHLHHCDEGILYVTEGSFRAEEKKEDGRQHKQLLAEDEQSSPLSFLPCPKEPGNQMGRRPVIEAGSKPGVSHGPVEVQPIKGFGAAKTVIG